MLLVADIGNSHTKLACFAGGELQALWRVRTDPTRTADEWSQIVQGLLLTRSLAPAAIEGVAVASVVPRCTSAWKTWCGSLPGVVPLVVDRHSVAGLVLDVDEPERVGADRLVNAWYAYHRFGGPVVVVDIGTALTLDYVTDSGHYLGGVITAGPETVAVALATRTAQLPSVDLVAPPAVLGRSTTNQLRSGILYGAALQIDGLVARIAEEVGSPTHVVATGGFAVDLARLSHSITAVDPLLTLAGLARLHSTWRSRT